MRSEFQVPDSQFQIPASAHIGAVHLTIADLDRSIRFYQSRLGFSLHRRDESTASLGAGGPDLLLLSQSPRAPHVRGTTGLYHFAVLVPSRADLARTLRRLIETGTVMQGAELRMGADPVDFDTLLAEASGAALSLAPSTTIGHVHLHVARLEDAQRFYVDVLGFELTQRYGPGALFVSAGGYHHHVGLNTWAGVGAPPPPPGAIGLRHFDLALPDRAALDAIVGRVAAAGMPAETVDHDLVVRDPSQNAIRLVATSEFANSIHH